MSMSTNPSAPSLGGGMTDNSMPNADGVDTTSPGFQTSWQMAGYPSLEAWQAATGGTGQGQIGFGPAPVQGMPTDGMGGGKGMGAADGPMASPVPSQTPPTPSAPVMQTMPQTQMPPVMQTMPQTMAPPQTQATPKQQFGGVKGRDMSAGFANTTTINSQNRLQQSNQRPGINQFAPGMPGMPMGGGGRVQQAPRMNDQMMFNQSMGARIGSQFGNNLGQTAFGNAPANRYAPPNAPGVRSAPITRPRIR